MAGADLAAHHNGSNPTGENLTDHLSSPNYETPEKYAPISAIVVGLNEGHLLGECLASASFCDEKLYVDLGSRDNSLEIARELGWETKSLDPVPIVEFVHSELKSSMKHPWILFLDPDERISPSLASSVVGLFKQGIPETVGALSAPCLFHFKGKRLAGTPWGGEKLRPFIAHRDRFSLTTEVHRGREVLEGFEFCQVGSFHSNEHIKHFWSDSWGKLIQKHRRYLRHEGVSQLTAGRRTTPYRLLLSFPRYAAQVLREKEPFKDGLRGIGLSVLWVTYKFLAEWELFKKQKRIGLDVQSG